MKFASIIATALIAFSAGAFAQTTSAPASQMAGVAAGTARTVGEIRKVDKEAGKITIRHDALVNLGMPAMTMVFRAADPKFLDQVKEGDKVSFVADKVNGAFTVVAVDVVK
jgi:Cu(I)/Ag(I) efflux system protein CusF